MDYYFQIIDFPLARSIYWRAKAVLKDRDHEERALGGEKLRELVNEFAENRLQEDISEFIEKYSNKLIEHGGWEIGYFPDDHKDANGVYHFSHADAAYLLENWPDPSNLPDDFPTEHLSDLDALSEILDSGFPYDDIKGGGFKTEAQHLPPCKVRRCKPPPVPATTANCSPKTASPLPA